VEAVTFHIRLPSCDQTYANTRQTLSKSTRPSLSKERITYIETLKQISETNSDPAVALCVEGGGCVNVFHGRLKTYKMHSRSA